MTDMLVKLYELPPVPEPKEAGFTIRRAMVPEMRRVVEEVGRVFGDLWASECAAAFAQKPVKCFLAVRDNELAGFACYDTTFRGFFGPTGVFEEFRGAGLGKSLFIRSLHALRDEDFAYAIIGGAGPVDFYAAAVGAVPIPGSVPGAYAGLLVSPEDK